MNTSMNRRGTMDYKKREDLLEYEPYDIKVEHYHKKNEILSTYASQVTAEEMYTEIFGSLDIKCPIFFKDKISKQNKKGTDKILILEDAIYNYKNIRNISVGACQFYNDVRRLALLKNVFAIVIDADSVTSNRLEYLLKNNMKLNITSSKTHRMPKPTFLVNSGTGIHLYYVFGEPIPFIRRQEQELKDLYNKMVNDLTTQHHFGMKPQTLWIGQPFRMVGSPTKLCTETTAYRYGDVWNIDDLAKWYKVQYRENKNETYYSEEKNEYMPFNKRTGFVIFERRTEKKKIDMVKEIQNNLVLDKGMSPEVAEQFNLSYDIPKAITTAKNNDFEQKPKKKKKGWKTNSKFYDYVLANIKMKTTCGHRYYSMVALCAVAKKCEIEREQLIADLKELVKYFNIEAKEHEYPLVEEHEIETALASFKDVGKRNKKETLENWLGWKFEIKKRNYRSQEAHLKRARAMLKMAIEEGEVNMGKKADKYKAKIEQYMNENPTARKCDVIRGTGFDKKTVYKYYDMIKSGKIE